MPETFDITGIWARIMEWCESVFWTQDTLYQGILIVSAFLIGGLFYRLVRGRVQDGIENAKYLPAATRPILRNLGRLIFPFSALVILFIGTQILSIGAIAATTVLTQGIMKVILAWIAIRLALQFIGNRAIRNFFALIIWSVAALSIFGILQPTMIMLESLAFSVGDFRLSALAVIKSMIMLFALLYFALFVSKFAERKILTVKSLTRSSQVLVSKVVRVALIVFALLIGITSAGIDLSLFAVFGGAIGLGIGFGLQKVISNLFSGMLLLMDQSIKPGDVIELPDIGTFGWVNQMAARYTEIVTRDNKSFLIPNEDFITQRVVNWSHGNSLIRLDVRFGVHYKSDPHLVKKMAEDATVKASDRIAPSPQPVCHLTEFGDSSLNFSLRFWIKDAEAGVTNIKGQVMLALWDVFKENDIEIPYPHREVYMHDGQG